MSKWLTVIGAGCIVGGTIITVIGGTSLASIQLFVIGIGVLIFDKVSDIKEKMEPSH